MSEILTDRFGRAHSYLRISVTERCNLRCKYCMPADGVQLSPREAILTFEEIERIARLFVENGITKIRLTGGEPLVRKDVEHLAALLGALPGLRNLALTTNGLLLRRKLPAFMEAGLDSINISLDTLRRDRFEQITRRPGLDIVLDAIRMAVEADFGPVKVNCVVIRGFNDDELSDFVQMTAHLPVEMRFIEYMPFDGNGWDETCLVPYQECIDRIEDRFGPLTRLPEGPNDTAKSFCVDGFAGRLGFISSMSDHFCAGCNRLRLTADGNLKVCLFGKAEVSLRDLIRTGSPDEHLEDVIRAAVQRKAAHHAGMLNIASSSNRPMILIGG